MLNLVYWSGLRLQRLVNTLLDFSRIEAGRAQASYEPTDLAKLTEHFASPFRSAMERAGLQYVVDCESLSESVYVDGEMWEKIVLNLISNALKYTHVGSVAVSLRERPGFAELSTKDTGIGIPRAELPYIFERFHRVEGARGRTHEGTGIGLALVQELVQLQGGSVRAESEAGSGSECTVSIPFGRVHLPADRVKGQPAMNSTRCMRTRTSRRLCDGCPATSCKIRRTAVWFARAGVRMAHRGAEFCWLMTTRTCEST